MMLKDVKSISYADFLRAVEFLQEAPSSEYYSTIMHPATARELDWHINRPLLRTLYRGLGFPRGRNQGAFKQWALLVGRF